MIPSLAPRLHDNAVAYDAAISDINDRVLLANIVRARDYVPLSLICKYCPNCSPDYSGDPSLLYRPLLTRSTGTGREDQRSSIGRAASQDIQAFTADADDLPVGNAPLLAGSAIAGHNDDLCALRRRAALHIQTTTEARVDLTVADRPNLIRGVMAMKQPNLRAIGRRALMFRQVDTGAAGAADQLRRMSRIRDAEQRGQDS